MDNGKITKEKTMVRVAYKPVIISDPYCLYFKPGS